MVEWERKRKTLLSLTALAISLFGLMVGVNAQDNITLWDTLKECIAGGDATGAISSAIDVTGETIILQLLDLGGMY